MRSPRVVIVCFAGTAQTSRSCDGSAAIALWGGNYFANALPASRCWLVWDKENTGSFADAELAWTNQDKIVRLIRHQWSGLIKASERGERRVHPTQKPVALAEWVIETLAPEAVSVIDLFLGSGSTLIAAENRRMACFGAELSPAYIDVAVKRWSKFTGHPVLLADDGRTFDEVSIARRHDSRSRVLLPRMRHGVLREAGGRPSSPLRRQHGRDGRRARARRRRIATMSHLIELAGQCAVTCAKSDNMRVTASKIAHEAVEYLKTDAGIMEAIAANVEPNTEGFHYLVASATRTEEDGSKTPILPGGSAFMSLRSFQRLLQIAGNPDKDAELRRDQAAADKARRSASRSTAYAGAADIADLLQTPPASGANGDSVEEPLAQDGAIGAAIIGALRAKEPPKVVTTDDLRTWIDRKPALPMSELFTALWESLAGGERITLYELVTDRVTKLTGRGGDRPPRSHRTDQ